MISTLLGVGYKTTVTSMGWILFELTTHSDEKLFVNKYMLRELLMRSKMLGH